MAAVDFGTSPSTTTTYNDTVYSAIIADMVLDALMAHVVTPPLLRRFDLRNQPSKSVDVPKADKFTAAAVSEGTELANTALTTAKATGTAGEVGIMATVTDVLEVSDIPAAHAARLKQLGRAIADKIDVDITALFASFSSSVGTTTVDLSLANLLTAIYTLEVANAPKPYVGVLHPIQINDMRVALESNANAPFRSMGIQSGTNELGPAGNGFAGEWFGLPLYFSTNVPTANAGADRAGGVFSVNYALGMVEKWASKIVPMYWPPIRGWVLTATANYGVFEIEDAAGVAVITDA
jgi:N4-gp56 family major capsid protein